MHFGGLLSLVAAIWACKSSSLIAWCYLVNEAQAWPNFGKLDIGVEFVIADV